MRAPAATATLDAPQGEAVSVPVGALFAGRYQIVGELGRGAMGVVLDAKDELLGENVALKLLQPFSSGARAPGTDVLERFRREVRLARRISHPHVARTHDLGEWEGTFYLTMERVEGESLAQRLARQPAGRGLPVDEVLAVGRAIAEGLAAAHRSGVVHCDLKPDNVMLDRKSQERVVVTDFGIARALGGGPHETGRIAGTPAYMAPEQLEGRPTDARTDLYALGVLLFEALEGELPFSGATPIDVGMARLTTPPRSLRRTDVPPALSALVGALLSRAPEDRPESAEEVAQRLDRIARGEVAELDEVAAQFRAGHHQAVLARTFDGAAASVSPEHAPFVVGSLALLGRLEEALALASSFDRPDVPSSTAVPVRFFAVVGLVHSGRYDEALRWVRRNARASRDRDATTRFYAFQGLALVRYFTGAVGRARLSARRALKEAVTASFSYGRLLALDLSGHVLVQRGEVSAGLRVLEQAEKLAAALGAPGHGTSIACARLAYENRHGRGGADLEGALSEVAAHSGDNVYALRAAWLELAFRSALLGEQARAREALERAREQALPERDHRARARLFLVEAILLRLDGTMAQVVAALDEAAAALDRGEDRGLRTELWVWDRLLGAHRFAVDAARAHDVQAASQTLIADVLVALTTEQPLEAARQSETPLYALLTRRDEDGVRARLAMQRGWLGLIPLLFAPVPGRHLFFLGEALIAADRGNVSEQERMPGHAREILEALRDGPRSKEDLVREVWRVARYVPQLHDPVVHTAIARLRRALGGAADWLETSPTGYALARDIQVHAWSAAAVDRHRTEPPAAGERAAVSVPLAPLPKPRPAAAREEDDTLPARIQAALSAGPLAVRQLAEQLGVSEATALRRLRVLVNDRLVRREGAGKLTRYRLG